MKLLGVDWDELKSYYERRNVHVKNLPIVDVDADDIANKVADAAIIL